MSSRADGQRVMWLVRHGETTWNSMGWVQGHVDGARLTRIGRHQARQVAELLVDEPVGAVYSSDLYRARRTAAVVAERVHRDVLTDRRLRERCFGVAEGVPASRLPSVVTGIRGGIVVNENARAPGGESLLDVYLRCSTFLRRLIDTPTDGDVVVVAHGGSIRMLRALVDNAVLEGLTWDVVPNAGTYQVVLPRPSILDTSRRS
jgi:2,3-bisphosphoglycerate-dependent phosphoglycerate mutase